MVQYKKFQLDSLFDIQKVRGINKSGLTKPSENECYDYITRTSRNNGIESQTGLVKSRELNEAGTFSLGLLQMTFFYRDKPWYAGQFVRKIVPKQRMTREQLLYFLGAFQALRPLLSGVLVRRVDETFSNAKIELPVTPAGQLDFEYMTARIRELETQRIRELETYLQVIGLDNTKLSTSEVQALTQKVQWKKFRIGDVFEKADAKFKGKQIDVQHDVSKVKSEEFDLPVVSVLSNHNGVMYYGRSSEWTSVSNSIDIVQNGAKATGCVFYQPEATSSFRDAYLVKFKGCELTPEQSLYMVGSLKAVLPKAFSRDQLATWTRVQDAVIQLPVTSTGDIDFDYMQNYIRATEKQTIKGVVEYKDRVIEETKKVVNEQ